MRKRILCYLAIFTVCFASHLSAFAGNLFNVRSLGTSVSPFSITLCLNALGPASCQNYTVSALDLSIQTTIPNHTYTLTGIKTNTAGYTVANCTQQNGYCIFSVSDQTASSVTISPPYSVSGTISGLTSSGLVLENNSAYDTSIAANANSFVIPNSLGNGGSYNITVKTQPTREFCTVNNGSGTAATGNITNVDITCTPVPLAYITSDYLGETPPPNLVQYCTLTASSDPSLNGNFQSCATNDTPTDGWNPYSVAFANIDAKLYSYVVSNRSLQTLYACGITPSTGAFTGAFTDNPYCFEAYTPATQPTGNAIATIAETQYLYYVDNVRQGAYVCTISTTSGVLTCSTAIPNGTPTTQEDNPWSPYTLTIQKTVDGTPYAYAADYSHQEVFVCPIDTGDGTFTSCSDAGGESNTWYPHGIAFATVHGTRYAYIASPSNTPEDKGVYKCSINSSDGTFSDCSLLTPPEQSWKPQGIDFAIVNGTQYAYVASNSNPFSIFKCTLNDDDGSFNTCTPTYTASADDAPFEVNITMQTIPSG